MAAPVRLNVYDMYWVNDYAHSIGFGVFHSGIEVYGVEYAYGGHQLAFSGIFTNSPQDAEELGETFKFRESIYLGETALSKKSLEKLIKSMGDEFRGDRYHLISKNCNHFAACLAKELTGVEIPSWVNRLATLSSSIPFLQKIVPLEWLTPMVLEQSLNDGYIQRTPTTMNYPSNGIDEAEDALKFCGNSLELKHKSSNGQAANSSTNGSASAWFRRTSSTTTQSAPNSSRNNGSLTPTLTRFWNSIKNIVPDDQPTSRLNGQK